MRDLALRVGITAPDFARHHPSPPPPTRTPHDMSASSSSSTTASLSLPVLIEHLRSTVPADKHAALNAAEKDITAAAPEALSTVRARHDCERVLIPFSRLFFVVSHAYFSVVCLSFAVSRRSSSGCATLPGRRPSKRRFSICSAAGGAATRQRRQVTQRRRLRSQWTRRHSRRPSPRCMRRRSTIIAGRQARPPPPEASSRSAYSAAASRTPPPALAQRVAVRRHSRRPNRRSRSRSPLAARSPTICATPPIARSRCALCQTARG